jgi:hypothetical protein
LSSPDRLDGEQSAGGAEVGVGHVSWVLVGAVMFELHYWPST